MVNFPGGFPGRFPGGSSSMPQRSPGGFPFPVIPPSSSGGFLPPVRPPSSPGGFPPPGRPPGTPGFPGQGIPGGAGNVPGPSRQVINQFNLLSQNPAQAQTLLQSPGEVTRFAAGCDGRWTIILLRNGQLFLMYVLSSNVYGNTMGIIWPNFTIGSFPSSAIAAYSCY